MNKNELFRQMSWFVDAFDSTLSQIIIIRVLSQTNIVGHNDLWKSVQNLNIRYVMVIRKENPNRLVEKNQQYFNILYHSRDIINYNWTCWFLLLGFFII